MYTQLALTSDVKSPDNCDQSQGFQVAVIISDVKHVSTDGYKLQEYIVNDA